VNNIPIISSDEVMNSPSIELIKQLAVKQLVSNLENGINSKPIQVALNAENLEKEFLTFSKLVEAAGGIVFNPSGKFLLIHRRGWWDLPKGKLDKAETPPLAALREVWEECGLKNLKITGILPESFHTYREKGKLILKKTYWYAMEIDSLQNPILQSEEDIEDSAWVTFTEFNNYKDNTYPNIIRVVEFAKN
jgi:8-oxo-dGTP pyrophosphatase MutT (NUDIX family)